MKKIVDVIDLQEAMTNARETYHSFIRSHSKEGILRSYMLVKQMLNLEGELVNGISKWKKVRKEYFE